MPFLLGSALLGTIGVFVHQAAADPLTITWFRCAFGLLGLTAWLAWRRQLRSIRLSRETAPRVLMAALLMLAAWALFFAAIERTSAGVAVVLFHMQPLWVLVLGALWLGEAIGPRRIAAVAAATIGLVLATGILEHSGLMGEASGAAYWWGVAACLVGAFFTACVTILAKRLEHMPSGVLAWWQGGLGALLLFFWPVQQGWPAWGEAWAWLSGLGLIHTGLAYGLMYAGMAGLSTSRIAVFQFVYPAIAIVIDWLWFGEPLGPLQLSGVVIMAVAIWAAERQPEQA